MKEAHRGYAVSVLRDIQNKIEKGPLRLHLTLSSPCFGLWRFLKIVSLYDSRNK